MKHKLFFFFILIPVVVFGQTFEGKVLDRELNTPIIYANITFLKSDKGTYSDENGRFKIEVNTTDSLLISSLGYDNKIVRVSEFNLQTKNNIIKLEPRYEKLEEIVLTNKKIKYSGTKSFGDNKRGIRVKTSLPFGYEFANFIQNPKRKKGVLKTVSIFISKGKEYDYLSSYNIKFYSFDEFTKQPGSPLYFENFIVEPLNKTYELEIDVSDLNIEFPENGICVGVEIVNTKYKTPLKSMAIMAPRINFTHTDYKIVSWGRYRNKSWKVNTRKSPFRRDFMNARINIRASIEK